MQDLKLMTDKFLFEKLCDAAAKMDAADFDLIDSRYIGAVSESIAQLRRELLLRISGDNNTASEELLERVIKVHVDSANSGEDKSPEVRVELDVLMTQVLSRMSPVKTAQSV